MSHMNYFEPYEFKAASHEDQLTRAFLVVLRFSPAALLLFYDKVRKACLEMAKKKSLEVSLPSISELPLSGVEFSTQKKTISQKPVSTVLSILLTDSAFEPKDSVSPSDRDARYDGIINFGDEIALVIENKPLQANVWEGQLNPSRTDLPEGAILIKVPAIVEWKSLVSSLNELVKLESLGGAEKLLIDDFLSYVNKHFSYLNPFDRLSLCKDISQTRKRIEMLLLDVARSPDLVTWHHGWQTWCIAPDQPAIKLIGVTTDDVADDSGYITVRLYYGDTQAQSQAFYSLNLDYECIEKTLGANWKIIPNFHVAFAQRVLLRLDCPPGLTKDYYDYWRKHPELIKQHSLDDLLQLINTLKTMNLVTVTEKSESAIESVVKAPKYKVFNICPSMGIHYKISINSARELDDHKKLAGELYKRMKEGLNLVLSDVSSILKEPND